MQRYSFLFVLLAALAFVGLANATTPTIPSGIQYYVAVNITNSQTTATPSPFQQMINITESSFSNYIAYNNNFANFEYFYANGTIIPAWIESNSSGKLITWVKLTPSIPANGMLAIYLGFANKTTNLLSSSGTSGIGEAPQLSSTYGQYDDGASVFNFYDNFAGTSLSSKWTQGIGSGGTITVNNGLTISSTTNYDTFVQSVSTFSVPIIAESYVTASAPTTNYERATVFIGTGSTTNQNVVSYGYFFEDVYASGQRWEIGDSSSSNYVATSTALNGILGGYWIASGNEQLYYNYAQQLTWTDTSQSPSATTVGLDVAGVRGGYSATFKWLRTRAYPPKGVMPSVSFGSVQQPSSVSLTISPNPATYGQSITITATCPQSTDTCAIDYPSLGTHIATGTGTATYTFNAFALGAGTYSYFYANDLTSNTVSAGATLTINKNSTYTLSLTGITTGNLQYSGVNQTATATIKTYNNQLTANLWLNNVQVGSTNTVLTYNAPYYVGSWTLTFNSLGNANYTAATTSASYINYVPVYLENTTKTASITPSNLSIFSYYPIKLYTNSPTNTITYNLNQTFNTATTSLQTNTLNINYIPPANQPTGTYTYAIKEMQNNNTVLMKAIVSLNMTDISSAINYSSLLQYYPILAHTPSFTAKPTSWAISLDQVTWYPNGSSGVVFSTPYATSFSPYIKLNYPFTSFILNYSNNPKVQNSILIAPFQVYFSNTINASNRLIANITTFNQQNFKLISANQSWLISFNFNNYVFSKTVSNYGSNTFYIQILKSNFQNPNVTFQLNGTVAQPNFFSLTQLFCPSTVANGQSATYTVGLPDTNGTKYSFYIYTSTGISAASDILFINELKGTGPIGAESLVIPPSVPMAVPLETTGQEYQYIIYSSNCKNVYFKGSFVSPTNPTYLTLVSGPNQAVIYNMTQATGACTLNTTTWRLFCVASDPTSQTYKYTLYVYNQTNVLGAEQLILEKNFTSSAFTYNTTLPANGTYSYKIIGYAFRNLDPVFVINSGLLVFKKAALSTPLAGFIAFILMLALIFIGVLTGKPLVLTMLMGAGMFFITFIGLEAIGINTILVFIVLEILVSIWSIKTR